MKKFLFVLIAGSVLFAALFWGCNIFAPPDTHEGVSGANADPERKDELALKHLIVPNVSEDTLASYVMSFLNANSGVFNANNIPLKDDKDNVFGDKDARSTEKDKGFYRYGLEILTGVKPK